jgi:hypothetical protein
MYKAKTWRQASKQSGKANNDTTRGNCRVHLVFYNYSS